jgi:uncharacterized protein Veg
MVHLEQDHKIKLGHLVFIDHIKKEVTMDHNKRITMDKTNLRQKMQKEMEQINRTYFILDSLIRVIQSAIHNL